MEDALTLAELLFHAERFCLRVESAMADCAGTSAEETEELRLKISQSRGLLSLLQTAYEEEQLTIENPSVRGNFRVLILTLLWVAFRARHAIDYRTFRMLVLIESSFTYLLIMRS